MVFRIALAASITLSFVAPSQAASGSAQSEQDVAARIAVLTQRLQFRQGDPRDERRYYAELDALTQSLRQEIDRYINITVKPDANSAEVQASLRRLLADHSPHPDYGDLPFTRMADLREGRALLAAYTIVRPPHHDIASIRGYRAGAQGLQLVATEGGDFEGYGMHKKEISSPLAGELWLFAWGQAHTFNGTKVRFRIYSFDGEQFRTVWSPDDMFNARVTFRDNGFSIDHHVRQAPYDLHDEYVITADGPVKTTSR